MNKIIKKLAKLSDTLDEKGLHKEVDYLDNIIANASNMDYKKRAMNRHIARDLGLGTDTFFKMIPKGYEATVGKKRNINLTKQVAPFSVYKNLILKALKANGLPKDNLEESWCIYPKVSNDQNMSKVEIKVDLNTFTCNYLYVTVPMWNSKYGKMLRKKYSTSKS